MILECIYQSLEKLGHLLFLPLCPSLPICLQFIREWCAKSLLILPRLMHSCHHGHSLSHHQHSPKFLKVSQMIILFYTLNFNSLFIKQLKDYLKNLNHSMCLFKLLKQLQWLPIYLKSSNHFTILFLKALHTTTLPVMSLLSVPLTQTPLSFLITFATAVHFCWIRASQIIHKGSDLSFSSIYHKVILSKAE